MRPRLVLHLAALVLPVAAVVGALLVLQGDGGLSLPRLGDLLRIAVPAVLAAQIAAALGARWLLRPTASAWLLPLAVGFGMALLTHLLFGPLFVLSLALGGERLGGDSMKMMVLFWLAPAVFVGWLSAPLTMAVGVSVDRLRRRELAHASA
jgi:hypothetical protein